MFSLVNGPMDLASAMKRTGDLLGSATEQVFRLLRSIQPCD
jgi:hypothetical protein